MDLSAAIEASLLELVRPVVWLTHYAVRLRYPGDFEEPSLEQATAGLASVRMVHASIADRLGVSGAQ